MDSSYRPAAGRLGLGGQPGAAVGGTLDSLVADPTLTDWKRTLALERDRQRAETRDVGYAHACVKRVAETLRGGLPTNAPDLLALVADHLDDFAAELSGRRERPERILE